jgi:hypothetical protein
MDCLIDLSMAPFPTLVQTLGSPLGHSLLYKMQVFCVFMFIAGASLFGVLLSELDEILQNMSRESRLLSDHLERYISFMSEYR